eukprot:14633460-Ditylum_brightwellii.AAC.1
MVSQDESDSFHAENNDFDPGLPLENLILLMPFGHRKVFRKKDVQKQSKMNQWCPKTRAIHFTLKPC